jgi:hypothetical protein
MLEQLHGATVFIADREVNNDRDAVDARRPITSTVRTSWSCPSTSCQRTSSG